MALEFSVWPAQAVETLQAMADALVEVTGSMSATEIAQLRLLAERTVLRGFPASEVDACVSEALNRFDVSPTLLAGRLLDVACAVAPVSHEVPVQMPALGASVTEGTVTRWLKSVGERVDLDEPVAEVSTDKVDTEIPAPVAGVITRIVAETDDTISVGATLCLIRAPDEAAAAHPAPGTLRAADTVGASAPDPAELPVQMPDLGEGVSEGTITRWLKSVGEQVELDEALVEISTDKVDTEVPAPCSGVITRILVEEDDTAFVGDPMCFIRPERSSATALGSHNRDSTRMARANTGSHVLDGHVASSSTVAHSGTSAAGAPTDVRFGTASIPRLDSNGRSALANSDEGEVYITPLVRKLAIDHGVDLSRVRGTGVGGRIMKRDVLEAARSPTPTTRMNTSGWTNGDAASAPLLEHRGWSLHGDSAACFDLIRRIALSLVERIPLPHLKIRVYDPDFHGVLGILQGLRDTHPDTYPPPAQTRQDLRSLLSETAAAASAAGERISARYLRTLGELWRADGHPSDPYVLLVVLGYPSGVDVDTQEQLIRLAKSAPARGISLVVHTDDGAQPDYGVDPSKLLDELTSFTHRESGWRTDAIPPDVRVLPEPPPSIVEIQRILSRAVDRAAPGS